ncbi:MAG: L-threonylcarbamoyladenylate synthase [Candidatus Eisenbacteria bacterium]
MTGPAEILLADARAAPGVDRIVRVIRSGGVLAYPAETMYGLGGDGLRADVAVRLAALKGSPSDKAFLLLLDDEDRWRSVASRFPEAARRLARKWWPGPLTILLPARVDCVAAREGKVAVRVPDLPALRRWIEAAGVPLFSTSANRSGEGPVRDPAELRALFGGGIDLLVAGPRFPADGPPSTVVDGTVDPPLLVRAGAVPFAP